MWQPLDLMPFGNKVLISWTRKGQKKTDMWSLFAKGKMPDLYIVVILLCVCVEVVIG